MFLLLLLIKAFLNAKLSSELEIINTLREHIPPGTKVALLNMAWHDNIGDSLILMGEFFLLKELGAEIVYKSYMECDISALRDAIGKDGIIIFHGGGNFGDIWPVHQAFRKKIIRKISRPRIIIFPQSVHYRNNRTLNIDKILFSKFPNVQVFARSIDSFEFLQNHFPNNEAGLLPDLSVLIETTEPTCEPSVDIVYLSRRDAEKMPLLDNLTDLFSKLNPKYSVFEFDWHDWDKILNPSPEVPSLEDPESRANFRFEIGNMLLCRGRVIITDRLHGVIMSLLIGKPVIAFDNIYGKLKSCLEIIEKAEGRDLGVKFASTIPEAYEHAKEILGKDQELIHDL